MRFTSAKHAMFFILKVRDEAGRITSTVSGKFAKDEGAHLQYDSNSLGGSGWSDRLLYYFDLEKIMKQHLAISEIKMLFKWGDVGFNAAKMAEDADVHERTRRKWLDAVCRKFEAALERYDYLSLNTINDGEEYSGSAKKCA